MQVNASAGGAVHSDGRSVLEGTRVSRWRGQIVWRVTAGFVALMLVLLPFVRSEPLAFAALVEMPCPHGDAVLGDVAVGSDQHRAPCDDKLCPRGPLCCPGGFAGFTGPLLP